MTTAIAALADLEKLKSGGKPVAINFHADWCEPCGAMNAVFATLASQHGASMTFATVDVEKADALTEHFNVTAVPTYVILNGDLNRDAPLARIEGADASRLTEAVRNAAPASASATPAAATVSMEDRLRGLINQEPVMVFMKGSPDEPKCGFSAKMVALLRKYPAVTFGSFDILSDQDVRNELKKFSNWPTYPQLYAGGKLLGGIDIAKEMDEEGELLTALTAAINAKK